MNSKFSMLKSIALAAALAAGVSGIARADDNSMSRFGGESYAYFNSAPVDRAASAWRQANPTGLSDHQFEALSSEGLASDFQQYSFDKAPSSWRQAHPNGLSELELQALSSEGPVWHQSTQPATSALSSTNATVVAKTAVK